MEKTRPARVEDRATLLATVAAKSQREGEGASKRKRLLARYGAHAGETLIVWKEARSKRSAVVRASATLHWAHSSIPRRRLYILLMQASHIQPIKFGPGRSKAAGRDGR